MRDSRNFTSAGVISVDGEEQPIWQPDGATLMSSVLDCAVVLLGRRSGRRLPRLPGAAHRTAQRTAPPRQRPGPPGASGAQLHPAAGRAADPAGAGHAGIRRDDTGARRGDGVRLRRSGAAAVRAERHPVPGRTGRQLAQANSVDLPRRRAIRAHRRRCGPDARLHLGRERRGLVHRARRVRPSCSALPLQNSVGQIISGLLAAVRAAVPARRLDRDADREAAEWSKSTGAPPISTPAVAC